MLAYESALSLARKIKRKEISSRELTELYIQRIEQYDNEINAVSFEPSMLRSPPRTMLIKR